MKKFKDISVRNKILLGYFYIMVLFIGLGLYYADVTRKISQASRKIEVHDFAEVGLIAEIQKNVLTIKNLHGRIYCAREDEQRLEIKKHVDICASNTVRLASELGELAKSDPDASVAVYGIRDLALEYIALVNNETQFGAEEGSGGDLGESAVLRQLEEKINELQDNYASDLSSALRNIDNLARGIRNGYIWTLLLLMFLSIWIAHSIAKIIVGPITGLVAGMHSIGSGNLNCKIEVNSGDEIGVLQTGCMAMADQLRSAHDSLEKEKEYLEIKVNDRTKDLEQSRASLIKINEELRQAQAQLIQSAKMAAVGLLAGGVAHEINNPLTGVLNNVELIKFELATRNNFADAELKELLNNVEGSTLRCKQIVQGLLEFSRIGKEDLEPVSINEVLEKTLFLASSEIKLENIALIRELALGCPLVMVTPNRLQQVFLDIINNAKWALRNKAGAELKIKTFPSADKRFVIIEIADNGCGIENQDLPRIFEPFFTTKKNGQGTGLGLSVSYQIIKEFNGVLEARSEGRGKGATFRIKLPVIM